VTVDVHAHYYPPEYVDAVTNMKAARGAHGDVARFFLTHPLVSTNPAFTGELEARIDLLTEAHIDTQVLSFASMNIWHPDPRERNRLVEAFNRGCSRVCADFAPHFKFLATLPFPHVVESVEVARSVRGFSGFAGYSVPTHVNGVAIDDPRWDPVYAAMGEEAAIVLVHPDGFSAPNLLRDYSMEWAIGAPFEDTIATIRLIRSGLKDRHPNLTWVLPHLGGTLPFLWHRITWRWELEGDAGEGLRAEQRSLTSLMFDNANSSGDTVALARAVLPSGCVVLGTDYPFVEAARVRHTARLLDSFGADTADLTPLIDTISLVATRERK
jgi:predicted TIM-barrel fold metal-dependent hydrolase